MARIYFATPQVDWRRYVNTSLEEYLAQVERNLRPVEASRRRELLLELRHHLEDSIAALSRKNDDEDRHIQSAIERIGPADEIGQALVKADRPRSRRHALLAVLPFVLLPFAGFLDSITAYNHSFITVVLLACLGVTCYFWPISGQTNWPAWSASWVGAACMLPVIITEGGQTTGGAGLFALSFLVPLVFLFFSRKQSFRHVLLVLGGIILVGSMIVLRVSPFRADLVVIGIAPLIMIVYFLRRRRISRAPIQPV